MAKFNITRIVPEGFIHSSGFLEVIDSLSWSLAALGHEVNVTQNWFSEIGETNIIFGAELIADFQRLPKNTILYNLEQPSHPNMDKVRRLAKESGIQVWDYSARSVEEWKKFGHENVKHVPIGYTPNLTRIPKAETQDIDVLFYGWMTERRRAVIEELKKAGLNVVALSACYGGGRDNLISRSKVVLNVHHDGRDRFEIVRCSYLMANSKCVVTEISVDDDEYRDLEGPFRVSYRGLVDHCSSLCGESAHKERQHREDLSFQAIKTRDFTQTVAMALDIPPARFWKDDSPAVSSAMKYLTERQTASRDYLKEARELKSVPHACSQYDGPCPDVARPRDNRVASRYYGAMNSGDMKDFVPWMKQHAKGNVVEIGVRDGASTAAFLSGVEVNGGHVYSIDVQPCGDLFKGHPQWSFLQANSMDTQRIIRFIPFEIDVLLIDGDHSRAGVINDFEYARQVRAGGVVLFHDIAPEERPSGCQDMSWPGDDVRRVYFEYCAALEPMGWTHEELPGRYGMGVLRKPPMTPPKPIAVDEIKGKFKEASDKFSKGLDNLAEQGCY